MAETLKAAGKVVQLRAGKARGAGGARGAKKDAAKLKPTPEASKEIAPPMDHEAAARQAQFERLTGLTHQHREVDNALELHDADAEDLRLKRKAIRAAIKGAVPLEIFDESYKDLRLKTGRTDLEAKELARQLIREVHGHVTAQQLVLDLQQPQPVAAKVATSWRAVGYQRGLLGEPCEPQAWGTPPEALQEASAGWGDGQAVIARGMKRLSTESEQEINAAPLIPGGPDWSDFDEDPEAWSVAQRNVFREWFEALGDEEIDISHEGVALAFDRAVEGTPFLTSDEARAALDEDSGEILH